MSDAPDSQIPAQDCELEYWLQQAENYAEVQIPADDLRAIIARATLLRRDEQREAEVLRLREALVQHNERLRSAIAVADRDGAETNWQALRGQLHYTAAEYSELVNTARAALEPKP